MPRLRRKRTKPDKALILKHDTVCARVSFCCRRQARCQHVLSCTQHGHHLCRRPERGKEQGTAQDQAREAEAIPVQAGSVTACENIYSSRQSLGGSYFRVMSTREQAVAWNLMCAMPKARAVKTCSSKIEDVAGIFTNLFHLKFNQSKDSVMFTCLLVDLCLDFVVGSVIEWHVADQVGGTTSTRSAVSSTPCAPWATRCPIRARALGVSRMAWSGSGHLIKPFGPPALSR